MEDNYELVEDMKKKLWEFVQEEIKKYRNGELEGVLLEMVPQAVHTLVELIKITRQN